MGAGPDHGIFCDGELLEQCADASQLLPTVEVTIYNLLHSIHDKLTVIHSAALQRGGSTLMLVGQSGAGKSSLALEAFRQGWTYRTDEITVTDGHQLWGIARAIQFEPKPVGTSLPPLLAKADTESCQWLDQELGLLCQPLHEVPAIDLPPAALEDVTLVFLHSGHATELTPVNGVEALLRLHQGCFGHPLHDLGALAARAWTLGWTESSRALQQIQELPEFRVAA